MNSDQTTKATACLLRLLRPSDRSTAKKTVNPTHRTRVAFVAFVAFVGFDDKDFFAERFANSGDIAAVTRVFGAQVDHENAALTQRAKTGVVEGLAAQLARLSVFVKAIDQKNVKNFVFVAHILGTIGANDPEMRSIFRNAEFVA